MLNDEQILLKTTQLLENLGVSQQKPDKLLREINEDELEVMQGVLDDLNGENLAFNKLFDGEMRKVIDFPTLEVGSDLGKFVDAFKVQEYDVDWDKGIVSGEKELQTADPLDVAMGLIGRGPDLAPKKRKIQMKIGKFLAKIADLASKRDVLTQKIITQAKLTDPDINITHSGQVTGNHISAGLGGEEQKRYRQLSDQLDMFIPNPGMISGNTAEWATKMAQYWQANAGYIKKEIKNLENDKYSIIITRHPIDVMRMSDFEDITSCHSPASRGGGSPQYYKCAVAEAQGHGAIAYVIETEDLLSATNTSNIQSAEQEIQEGEVFHDDNRSSETGDITPISRTRLRQMRYYDTDAPKRWDEGTELAVPEKRVYGVGIPGFIDRVVKWADENQKEAIRDMPETDEMVNLDRFWIFGGSYEDTAEEEGRKALLSALTGIDEAHFTGEVRQNKDTEGNIDANALGDVQGRWNAECTQIAQEWNNHYANTAVEFFIEDDGAGSYYINADVGFFITWDIDKWTKLPNPHPAATNAADDLNEYFGNIFDTDRAFLNRFSSHSIRWGCRVNYEHPNAGGSGEELFYDPEGFNDMCQKIDRSIDDNRDAFQEVLEQFFKREGYMDGGEYIKLAYEIEDTPFESYEWDVRSDGEDPTESYTSTAAISHDFSPEELGVDPRVLFDLLDSRDWRLAIRTELLKHPRAELGVEYYLDIENSQAVVPPAGQDIKYTITFQITADDPDARVQLFRELTTGETDDEDRLNSLFEFTMKQVLNARLPSSQQQNLDERLVKTWKGFLGI